MRRFVSSFMLAAVPALLVACGGSADLGGTTPPGAMDADVPSRSTDSGGPLDAGSSSDTSASSDSASQQDARAETGVPDGAADSGCPAPPPNFLVGPGGTIQPRPTGSALRLLLIYQGTLLAVGQATGVTMSLLPSEGPFTAGTDPGYWFELQDGVGAALYTRTFQDPSGQEGVLPDGGLVSETLPFCDVKSISVDVPNDPKGHAVVVFGSPYGTSQVASEIGRFYLP